MITQAEAEAWLETMTPNQRALALFFARLEPPYDYNKHSRGPKIEPAPPPGLPSAVIATEAIIARIDGDKDWPPRPPKRPQR